MKNSYLPVILIILLSLMVSCKKDETQKINKIGMFTYGIDYNDAGFKQNCRDGLLRARKEYSFDTLFAASLNNFQEELDYFPLNDFDLVFQAGLIGEPEMLITAANNPDVEFVIVDNYYEGTLNNIQTIFFMIDEAAFPLGFLAAAWADMKDPANPVVGIVGGMDVSSVHRFIDSYDLAVKFYNKKYNRNVSSIIAYTNDFEDVDRGHFVADSLIKLAGVDVIMPAAGYSGNGCLVAAKDNAKWGIGVDVDQYYSLPEVSGILLSSCIKRLDNAIYSVAVANITGQIYEDKIYVGNLLNNGVGIAPYHDFENQIPDSIKNIIETIKSGITAGTINTGY